MKGCNIDATLEAMSCEKLAESSRSTLCTQEQSNDGKIGGQGQIWKVSNMEIYTTDGAKV